MANANNGLITKIWGPPLWKSLHCITFGYPIKPTEEQKQHYYEFFLRLGDVLPCRYCRDSYKEFISKGNTKLNMEVMESRETLTRWLYLLHEEVNKKLDMTYGVTFEDIQKRYESFRASCGQPKDAKGCTMPLDEKARSYRISRIVDAPLIPLSLALSFMEYAKKRGVPESELYVLKMCQSEDKCIHDRISDIDCDLWCKRNEECREIIENMRDHGIQCIEQDGEFEGLPTYDEVRLIVRMSSNLGITSLTELIKKLPKHYHKRTFRLTK